MTADCFRRAIWRNRAKREGGKRNGRTKQHTHITERGSKHLSDLKASGKLLRQARYIRSLVAEVKQAIESTSDEIGPIQFASWEKWALGEATRLDPILSGQFKSHFIEPKLDD